MRHNSNGKGVMFSIGRAKNHLKSDNIGKLFAMTCTAYHDTPAESQTSQGQRPANSGEVKFL